jgi:hypothetical protein
MLATYKKAGNIALAASAVCIVAIGVLGRNSATGNVWGPGGAPVILMIAFTLSIMAMFWAYAKAKGYSGLLGLVLPFLSIVGLVILLGLKDKHPVSAANGPSTVQRWATGAFIAAGLAALAYVIYVIKGVGA